MDNIEELLKGGFSLEKHCHYLSYDSDKIFKIFITDIGGYFPEHPIKTGTLEECLEYMKLAKLPAN